ALQRHPEDIAATYWRALDKGRLADMKSVFSALGLLGEIKSGLDRTIELCLKNDPHSPFLPLAYAVRAAVYRESPGLLGGSDEKGDELLAEAVALDPHLTLGWIELARSQVNEERWAEARKSCQRILDETAPTYPWDYTLSDRPDALALLPEIEKHLR